MGLFSSLKELFCILNYTDRRIRAEFRFSQKEICEILSISRKENLKYFETLAKMPNLKYFDIGYLLSQIDLDEEKIALIDEAQKIYCDEEFVLNGQTQSDFVFRVAANLNYLNKDNIEIFKELVKCKNELYDFCHVLQNPLKYLTQKEAGIEFTFVTVYAKNN